jgi:hypothetical protein
MKFDIELPARGEGVGYLYVQAWDLDLIINEMLIESMYDITPHLDQAVVHYNAYRAARDRTDDPERLGGAELSNDRRSASAGGGPQRMAYESYQARAPLRIL